MEIPETITQTQHGADEARAWAEEHGAQAVQDFLEATGWSQRKLAQQLVSPTTGEPYHEAYISRILSGEWVPGLPFLAALRRLQVGQDGKEGEDGC